MDCALSHLHQSPQAAPTGIFQHLLRFLAKRKCTKIRRNFSQVKMWTSKKHLRTFPRPNIIQVISCVEIPSLGPWQSKSSTCCQECKGSVFLWKGTSLTKASKDFAIRKSVCLRLLGSSKTCPKVTTNFPRLLGILRVTKQKMFSYTHPTKQLTT